MRIIISIILTIVLSVASATAGIRHYCDYLGSTRAVVDTAGVLLQTMNYYPSGVPFSRMEQEPITDRLHTGKPFLDMSGLGYYDNNARFLDILTGSFISRDALAGSYPHLSPYANCANNPLIYIDPTGLWNVYVHLEKDRSISGYGIAIVTNNEGEEIFQFQVRAEGVNGRDRLKVGSDTPLGIYDIPDNNAWISGGNRKTYSPNPRLNMKPEKGEIVESGRDLIRIHGGRQE